MLHKLAITDKLIDECIENIEETKLVNITFTENENNYECGSCIVYIVLMIIAFAIYWNYCLFSLLQLVSD